VQVKICGIGTEEAALAADHAGASAVGFVFADSPRRVTPEEAARLAALLDPSIARVAVFRHPTAAEVARVLEAFPADVVQVESGPGATAGRDAGVRILPVLHDGPDLLADLRSLESAFRDGILLEAPGRGGRGVRPDWNRAAKLAEHVPLVLAGGLTPENVGAAIRQVRPAAVDVSSGVESTPGRKDPDLILEFVRSAFDSTREINRQPASSRFSFKP